MTVHLRPYQADAVRNVLADWERYNAVLGVAATGAGKTHILLSILLDHALADDPFSPAKRGMILAHRLELISQPLERIQEFWPEWALDTGIVMAEQNECNRSLIIATVQTVSNPKRMAEVLAYGPIDYLVIDESHRGVAKSYLDTYQQLRKANPKLKLLGVTATPIRTDRDGLKKVFEKVSFKYGIKELISLGHLVPFKALGVATGISLKAVKESDGDFVAKQLADAWECDNLYQLVIESHKKYAGERQGIAFTVSVEGAHRLAEQFCLDGIEAAAIDGTTPKPERARILGDFKAGKIKMLCNCFVLVEGFDAPATSVIHMARPTKSDLVYTQAIGRGLRTYPAKQDCIILDYAPEDARNIVMAGDLLGKPRKQKELEQKAQKAGVVISGFSFTGEGTGIDGDPDELVTRPLHYLSASPFAWYYHDGISTLGLGEKDEASRTLAICQNGELYSLVLVEKPKSQPWNDVTVLAKGEDFAELADQGSEYAEEHGAAVLCEKGKGWQSAPISEKQLDLLRRLMPSANGKLAGLTKGEGARLLTHQFARKALVKAGWRV